MAEITFSSPCAGDLATRQPVKIIHLQHPSSSPKATLSSLANNHGAFSTWKAKVKRMTLMDWIHLFLPCSRWISAYKWREYLQPDLMAGITVGIMLVPQFLWPPFVMGSIILAIILTMKHLGQTRKNLQFLRAAGPLTAVVLGTAFVKVYHPSSIS